MAIGTPYKQAKLAEQWDAIVIGSGIGGLTAAVLLTVHGKKRVLVLERHYEAGGFTHTFHRPGYEWDVGLHYIGQVQDERSSVRRAFDHVTAGKVQWRAMPETYDRFIIEGRTFDLVAGPGRFREGMKQFFPRETRAIDQYIAAVQSCNRASGLFYAEKAIPAPAAALAGTLMRVPYMRWAKRTTREVLESLTGNRELIGVLTAQWGDYGLPPAKSSFAVHATIAEHYFAGGSYPAGGASTIAAAMLPQIEHSGGSVVTSAPPAVQATAAVPVVVNASLAPPTPTTGDGKTRVLVTDSQSWEMRGGGTAGGNANGWGASSYTSGGARPQTAEIIKTLNQRCPELIVTNNLARADFVLTLDHEGGKGYLQRHNKIAVFNRDGDDIFSDSTRELGSAVKDACQAMLSGKK